jgi:hypothetical protein
VIDEPKVWTLSTHGIAYTIYAEEESPEGAA